jgi:uroporphyrinogen III methyltransferase/synthase
VTVYLVGAGPGDPGLLTRRGAELLARADVVLHDRLVSRDVLNLAPADAVVVDVGKEPDAAGEDRQKEIARLLVEHGRKAEVVVRLKGGDPFVFGRGGEEVAVLRDAGIDWEVVPGVTSAFGVPAIAGIPVTQRGMASSVTVVTGRVGDAAAPGSVDWDALARAGGTLVVLMGVTTRGAVADELVKGGRDPRTPVAVIERGTGPAERVVRTTLGQLGSVEVDAPAVIVIGPVAALGSSSHGDPRGGKGQTARPLAGRTVVATRSGSRAAGLVEALEGAGAVVVELPLTRQIDADDGGAALRDAAEAVAAGHYAWVVLTSVNAVERFVAALEDARAPVPVPVLVPVAAVGPATANALRRAGVEPDLVPPEHSARSLVGQFPDAPAAALPVLFACADIAPGTVVEGLGRKGWPVHRVTAYRTVPVATHETEVLARVALADAVVFTASSSVRAFTEVQGPDGAALVAPRHVVCIGSATARTARDAGLSGVLEAPDASTEGILAGLIDLFGPHDASP